MKSKKIAFIFTILLTVFLTACSNQSNTAKQIKPQTVVRKANKHKISSYHIKQDMTYVIGAEKQTMHQNLICGGKPLTLHANQSQNGQHASTWLNNNYEYIKENGKWFKIKIKKQAQTATAVYQRMKNSNNVLATNNAIAKDAKIKTTKNNYILTIKNNKRTNEAILKTTREALGRLGSRSNYKQIAKHLKITRYDLVETINRKTYQIEKVDCNLKMKIADQMNIETKQVLDHVDQYPKLKIPSSITKKATKMSATALR